MFCRDCKKEQPKENFYFNKTHNRYYYFCKVCQRKRVRVNEAKSLVLYSISYFKTPKGRSALIRASNNARKKFPEKWDARSKLRYAVKTGKIKKPTHCEVCDEIKTLQGHHPDYSKPLEVKWLCTRCHADEHLSLTQHMSK